MDMVAYTLNVNQIRERETEFLNKINQLRVYSQEDIPDLRDIFVKACKKEFGAAERILDIIYKRKFDVLNYDCWLNSDDECYIINRNTGEYINWYKTYHLGRDIHTTVEPDKIEEFLHAFNTEIGPDELMKSQME